MDNLTYHQGRVALIMLLRTWQDMFSSDCWKYIVPLLSLVSFPSASCCPSPVPLVTFQTSFTCSCLISNTELTWAHPVASNMYTVLLRHFIRFVFVLWNLPIISFIMLSFWREIGFVLWNCLQIYKTDPWWKWVNYRHLSCLNIKADYKCQLFQMMMMMMIYQSQCLSNLWAEIICHHSTNIIVR